MNQGDNSASSMPRGECKNLPHNAKELKKVSEYVAGSKAEVQKLSAKVTDMGFLSLLWDSKVPEKDQTFYHFFSLKVSNKNDVQEEVRKYEDFYEELCNAIHNMRNADEQTDETIWEIIEDLKEKLTEISKAAKRGENDTDSSTVYHLHRSFIQKHETLEYMIKRVECAALKNYWQESKQAISKLEDKLTKAEKKYESGLKEMKDYCSKIKIENEQLRECQKELIKTNKKMQQLIDILLKEKNSSPSEPRFVVIQD